MSTPLASAPASGNNFNLLRLLFAVLVVVYHVTVLSGVAAWRPAVDALSVGAELGVQGFFVLSGYLVYGSLKRSTSLTQYAEKRARRLYPAYATVVIVSAFAALLVSEAARVDWSSVGRYLGWNLVFLNFLTPNLPGLFLGNAVPEVNGSLWTLKIEVMFYLVLPLIAWLLRAAGRARWAIIALIYIAAEGWRHVLGEMGEAQHRPVLIGLGLQLPGQMSFFITGVALAMWPGPIRWRRVAPLGVLLFAGSYVHPAAEPLRALGLGLTAIWLAIGATRLPDAARFGDLSYGLYIVHFPIIQGIAALGLFTVSPLIGGVASTIGALTAALAMWWAVERPALRADSAYRRDS